MKNEYGFFTSSGGDRKYTAEDFCAFFSDFFTDGISAKEMTGFQVHPSHGMTLEINHGTAYVKGKWYRKSTSQTIELPLSDTAYDRYDAVVIRCDYSKREIYIGISQGTPSAEPERPSPRRDDSAYELVLAYICVKANSYEITGADITDTRFDSSLCGIVTNVVKSIDTTDLFAQYQAAWNDFIAQLGESDNVTINTEDAETRRQVSAVREQLPFGSMFMMV
ncbi:MAG: hypothetical protein IJZ72_06250 [Oscillospiraceae bacterium]|nr:hypothetical protein [Oscillospiraceae bacterium]